VEEVKPSNHQGGWCEQAGKPCTRLGEMDFRSIFRRRERTFESGTVSENLGYQEMGGGPFGLKKREIRRGLRGLKKEEKKATNILTLRKGGARSTPPPPFLCGLEQWVMGGSVHRICDSLVNINPELSKKKVDGCR